MIRYEDIEKQNIQSVFPAVVEKQSDFSADFGDMLHSGSHRTDENRAGDGIVADLGDGVFKFCRIFAEKCYSEKYPHYC